MFYLSAVSLVLIYSQNFSSSTVEIHTRIIRKIFNCVILQKLLFCWIVPYWWNWNHFHFIFVWNLRNLPRWSRLRYWFLRSLKWSPSWCGQNSHLRGHNEPQGRNFLTGYHKNYISYRLQLWYVGQQKGELNIQKFWRSAVCSSVGPSLCKSP